MLKKRGMEIQFNWIFVLVAGAAILLFFTSLVVKQRGVSETSAKATVLKSMEAIIIGTSVSTDTIKTINMPNSNIEIGCNRVSVGGISRQYQNLILFAPGLIKGNKLIAQTLPFNVPYKATNLLFMTNPQVRYIIIGSNDFARDVYGSLPSNLKKEIYLSPPAIKNENNYKIRFIVFDNSVNNIDLKSFPDSDVTALRIIGNKEKGTIEFYQENENRLLSQGQLPYITKSALIGAVYSDTKDLYECSMKNVFSRLRLTTDIYRGRTDKMIEEIGRSEEMRRSNRQAQCNQYSTASRELTKISAASSVFNNENINKISEAAEILINANDDAKKNSCPLIY
ncbi:MAG: hypothetical protein AABX33_07935 [Nanoarchaeota archaeon]